MATFVKKANKAEVEAMVWVGLNLSEAKNFAYNNRNIKIDSSFQEGVVVPDDVIKVNTPTGWQNVKKGQIIVKDGKDLYVMDSKQFDEEYDDPYWVARFSIGA